MDWRELGPGDRLGDFTIERKLGQGGMGLVFVARQDGLGRQVALKVIEPVLAANDEFRSRFEHEARALGSLTSKNVLTVHTVGDSDGMLYLATRLYPDGDLASLLEESGPLPVGVAVDVVAQVADGLADVHAIGLVHRDIKPANVLLARRAQGGWDAVLADFGVVRSADLQLTQAGGIIGTPQYMAPEMHLGAPATVGSDLYALGCVLWSTLTGTPSYAGDTREQLVRLHLRGSIPQLPGAGVDGLNRVLRTLLAKEPADRYPSAEVAARAMREAVAGGGEAASVTAVSRSPDLSLARDGSPRRPRGRPVALVLGSVVLVGAVAATLVATRDDAEPTDGGGRSPTSSAASTAPTTPVAPAVDAIATDRTEVRSVAAGFVELVGTRLPDDLTPSADGASRFRTELAALTTRQMRRQLARLVSRLERDGVDPSAARVTDALATGVAGLTRDTATVAVVAGSRPASAAGDEPGTTLRYLVGLERTDGAWLVSDSLVLGGTPIVTGPGQVRERIEPFVEAARAAAVDAAPALVSRGGSSVLTAGVADVASRTSVQVLVLLAARSGATDQVMLTLSLTGSSWIVTAVKGY